MNTPPTVFNANGVAGGGGVSSIADAAGNLLFYTDGNVIYTQLYTPMANGTGILGSGGIQVVLIAKQPGNNSLYYIFSAFYGGLLYSIVDMSLAAGIGSVTTKNATLTSTPQANKVAGTRHCNGVDLWIVSQDVNTGVTRGYLLSSSGLNTSPAISTTTLVNQNGCLKFSSDGNKLASSDNGSTMQVYDFNTATGIITGSMQIGSIGITPMGGVEFSPDGTKLYGTDGTASVWQWSICAGSPSAISANQYAVNVGGAVKASMQLGPDGKIYIARPGAQELAVINDPNSAGAACNYSETGQSIAPKICKNGLPNSIKPRFVQASFSHIVSAGNCQAVSFSTTPYPGGIITCMSTSATPVWNFGDPASGGANTSNLFNPTHTYTGPGTYTAMLIMNYNCGTDTLRQVITLSSNIPTLSISGNLSVCKGQSTTLTVNGATTYTWTGNGPAQTGSVIVVNPLVSGSSVYTVTGTGTTNCPGVVTVTLNALPQPTLTISGNTIICMGNSATLSVSGASTYTWSNGSISSSITVSSLNTAYPVSGTDQNGCVSTITVLTSSQPSPTISVNNLTICVGEQVALVASDNPATGTTYLWLPGSQTGNTVTVSPPSTSIYSVIASINSCTAAGSTTITVTSLMKANTDFSYDLLCINGDNSLPKLSKDFSSGGVFLWSPGAGLDSLSGLVDLSLTSPGTYLVTYTLSQISCTAAGSGTANVTIHSAPLLQLNPHITIAPGTSTMLLVSGGQSYTWNPSAGLSCNDCSNPVISPEETTQYCVFSNDDVCIAKACTDVVVSCDVGHDFSLPNAFTPNGDGENDVFCLQGWNFCVKSFEVLIFDRWGEKVFESNDPDFCWNGIYKGKLLGAEVFVYTIKASYSNNSVISKKGNITLIR